jgi:hypothetical protein
MKTTTTVLPNGVPIHLLNTPRGVCTIGAIFPLGSIHSKTSGETNITLQAKLLEAVGSRENVFMHQLQPTICGQREFSYSHIQFLPEKTDVAVEIFLKLIDGKPVSKGKFQECLIANQNAENLGKYCNERKYFDLSCLSSFKDKRYHNLEYRVINPDSTGKEQPTPNESILSDIPHCCELIGTIDMKETLEKIGMSLVPYSNKPLIITPGFHSGKFQYKYEQAAIQGSKISQQQDMSIVTITYPSASIKSNDRVAYDVLEKTFGGGTSFSSEGLGMGLSSKLYMNVVSGVPGCRESFANNFSLSTNGRFTLNFVVPPQHVKLACQRVKKTIDEILNSTESMVEESKKLVLSSNAKKIRNAQDRVNDVADAVLFQTNPKSSKEYREAIKSVTKEHLLRVANYSLTQKPAIGILGSGDPDEIAKALE